MEVSQEYIKDVGNRITVNGEVYEPEECSEFQTGDLCWNPFWIISGGVTIVDKSDLTKAHLNSLLDCYKLIKVEWKIKK